MFSSVCCLAPSVAWWGWGEGVVMIPLMVRFFGLNQHQAHGTSLAALVFTGLTGAATYSFKGNVDPLAAGEIISQARDKSP
jgi:uncharacterized protein